MELQKQITEDMKTALKASGKDPVAKERLGALRLLASELKYKKIEKKDELKDEDVIDTINSMIKKRRESARMFREGEREELAVKEENEVVVLLSYLPAQLPDEELTAAVEKAISKTGASSPKDMGKVMGMLVGQLKGKAEPSRISALVKAKLAPPVEPE